MANYPNAVPSFTTKSSGQTIQPAHINDTQDEVVAIGTDLLTVGTFTPTLVSVGGGTPTYSSQVGLYVRAGKAIIFSARVQISNLSSLAAGGITIGGLPFTSNATTNSQAGCYVGFFSGLATSVVFMNAFVNTSAKTITPNILTAAATTVTQLAKGDLGNGFDVIIGGSYFLP
jgi:hypothetical protein